jgi:hypothetical protein
MDGTYKSERRVNERERVIRIATLAYIDPE